MEVLFLMATSLEFVTCSRFLGVEIDRKFKFDRHIEHICSKISKSIGIMFRVRGFVPSPCLRNLYFSLIHPYLLYCLPVFGATYAIHLQPLIILQKRAIRIISNAGFLDHTEPLFKLQKILKLQDLYKYSLACYFFKNQNLLNSFSQSHNYNTRNRDLFLPPHERLRSTSQSVIYNGIIVWNNIPDSIKACRTIGSFKYQFRNHLLSEYVF